jgi:predicted AlkP superfamily pyrophosphatase or phosphodiesterase
MKLPKISLSVGLLTLSTFLLVGAMSVGTAVRLQAEANRDAFVIVVSIDGLPADYFNEPAAVMPTLHAMAKKGARAERMVSVFPTVTWPNHTSMVTGVSPARHGVIGNVYYDRATRQNVDLIWDPVFDKEDIVKVPTVYDVAHLAGLKTAGIAWPSARNAKHLDWQVPCVIDTELLERYTTPSLHTAFEKIGVKWEHKAEWNKVDGGGKAMWDWMHTQVAKQVVIEHRPNLLFLHIDAVDSLQHRSGRNHPEGYWAANLADHYLREIVEATQAAGIADRTTFIVVSDHGFYNYVQQINGNAVLRDMGLIKTAGNRVVEGRVHYLSMTGGAGIYVLDEANREQITRDLIEKFKTVEGIAAVIDTAEMVRLGLPSASADARAPDLMLSAAEGYSFSSSSAAQDAIMPISRVKGAHGYLPGQPKLYATFVAFGAGIQPGVTLPEVRNVDVAPTVAALLGLEMKDVEGRVLKEIFR